MGSKTLAADPELDCGPSTIRNELAVLEEQGLLAHPHTSAGRVPTDAGHRYYVDRLLPARAPRRARVELELMRREVDEAMRVTTETLSQVTNLLAIVSAPPIDTATIRHVEVLLLQPQVAMVVVITSTGGVAEARAARSTRRSTRGSSPGPAGYLNERLDGHRARRADAPARLADPTLSATERAFLERARAGLRRARRRPPRTTLYVDGAARLLGEHRIEDLRRSTG